ncbi:hypothetical protein HOY80DRAFT_472758 [Tuber brumale]|nr:hypothetical protein HOY80DRAFT_472758 [Tuber brumale]
MESTVARLRRRSAALRRRKRAARPSSPSYLHVSRELWQATLNERDPRTSLLLWASESSLLPELGDGFRLPMSVWLRFLEFRRGTDMMRAIASYAASFQAFGRSTFSRKVTPDSSNPSSNAMFRVSSDTGEPYTPEPYKLETTDPHKVLDPHQLHPPDYKPYTSNAYKFKKADRKSYTTESYSLDPYKPTPSRNQYKRHHNLDLYNKDPPQKYTTDPPYGRCTTRITIDQAPPTIHSSTQGLGDCIPPGQYLDIVTSNTHISHAPEVARGYPKQHHSNTQCCNLPKPTDGPLYPPYIPQTQPQQQQQQQQQQRSQDRSTESSQEYQTQLQISALFRAFHTLALLALHHQYLPIQQSTSPGARPTYLQWNSSPLAPSMRLQPA